jgi:hypothetical protein
MGNLWLFGVVPQLRRIYFLSQNAKTFIRLLVAALYEVKETQETDGSIRRDGRS